MWTMTPDTFTSTVAHRDDPALLMVRARDLHSLVTVATELGYVEDDVYSTFPADYPYRLVVTRVEYALWVHNRVLSIDYTNFKARAAKERDALYGDFLHRVWAAGHALTDHTSVENNDAAWDARNREWTAGPN